MVAHSFVDAAYMTNENTSKPIHSFFTNTMNMDVFSDCECSLL